MPARAALAGDGGLAGRVHHPREAGRAEDDRQRRLAAEDRRRRIDGRDIAEHVRIEHDVLERRDGAAAEQLALRGALDVVEHRSWRPAAGELAKVGNRPYPAPAIPRPAPERRPDEPRHLRGAGTVALAEPCQRSYAESRDVTRISSSAVNPLTPQLVLGPLLRYIGTTTATVWVETDAPAVVEVLGHRARTFQVAGITTRSS